MARKAKQEDLPGMAERRIEDLHKAALDYVSIRDERMELTEKEVEAKGEVLDLMNKHKRDSYTCEGVEIVFVPGEPTVKVKVHKSADEDDAATDDESYAKMKHIKDYWKNRRDSEATQKA
ncbi:MAG: hypothetical protein V1876_02380 [Candidatus Peregrinibacteria bacterium]